MITIRAVGGPISGQCREIDECGPTENVVVYDTRSTPCGPRVFRFTYRRTAFQSALGDRVEILVPLQQSTDETEEVLRSNDWIESRLFRQVTGAPA